MTSGPAVLALEGIEKAFGANVVLRGVDLSLARGEVHALLGENGAGKSTLMRILLGIEHADRGGMRLEGQAYRPRGPADARRAGVVMVPQERTLCPHLAVKTMTDHLRGEPIEKRIDTGARLVTKENLDDAEVKEIVHPDLKKWLGE